MSTVEDTELSQYVQGFRANLNLAPQQTDTRLLSHVDGDLAYDQPGQMFNADDVNPSEPEDTSDRVGETPDKFIGMTRRVGIFQPFHDSAWIDNVDKAREMTDPTSTKMKSLMAGRWRKVDTTIIKAALGPALSKLDDSATLTSTDLPAGQIVAKDDQTFKHDAEVMPTAGHEYGMSVGKLLHAKFLLDESELDGERILALTSQQLTDLLRRTPVTSRYYNEVAALSEGKLSSFLEFNIVKFKSVRIPSTGVGQDGVSARRQCVAYIKDAMVYRGRPITNARLTERSDRQFNVQAYYKTEHGAVRRYDPAVVEIDCYEGPDY